MRLFTAVRRVLPKAATLSSFPKKSAAAAEDFASPRRGRKSGGARLRGEVEAGAEMVTSGAYGSDQLYRISGKADKLVMTPMRRSRRHAQSVADGNSPVSTQSVVDFSEQNI